MNDNDPSQYWFYNNIKIDKLWDSSYGHSNKKSYPHKYTSVRNLFLFY